MLRPHGLRGEVVVGLTTDRLERLSPGARLETERGTLVVVSSHLHGRHHLVSFEGIIGREAAEALRAVELFAEPLDVDGALWVHDLVGSEVVTAEGTNLGPVVAVEANPASDLLVLASGALVPLRFVSDLEPRVRVTVDIPAGLLD